MRPYLAEVETRDGMRLHGSLLEPEGKSTTGLAVDAVIMVHGNGGNFYHPSMFEEYGRSLSEMGCAALRINTRAHDMVSYDTGNAGYRRTGTTYEVVDECRLDLEAWVEFLVSSGSRRIALWGHSLGAVKSIYYMALEKDSRVHRVVAASPPRFSYSAFTSMSEGEEFVRVYGSLKQMVDGGKPDEIMDVTVPYPYLASARQYLEKYGPDEHYNVLRYIPMVPCPLLVTIGTSEAQTLMTFRGLPPEVERLANESPHITFASIPDADHFYTGHRGYVWDLVSRWLSATGSS